MNHSTLRRHLLLALLGAGVAAGAQAEPMLKGKDITEKNLIEALTPGPDDEPEVRTRSIKVMRDAPNAKPGEAAIKQAARTPERKPSASLLITFETNSAQLTSRAKTSLDIVGKALQADKLAEFKFSIEGHADPRGTSDDNLKLSQARAESVVNYLASAHGISRDRLQPVGKGSTELANVGKPDAPENRRVTITTLRE